MAKANSFLCVCSRGLVNNNTLFDHLSSESVEKRDKPGQLQQVNPLYTENAENGEGSFYLWARGLPHTASWNGRTYPPPPPPVTGRAAQGRPLPTPHPPQGRALTLDACVLWVDHFPERKRGKGPGHAGPQPGRRLPFRSVPAVLPEEARAKE